MRFLMVVLTSCLWPVLAMDGEPGYDLWYGLQEAPPVLGAAPGTARLPALRALDDWLSEPNSEIDPGVIAYYQARVDGVLSLIEDSPVTRGVRVFQLYSSSMIVQSPSVVFAFDLDQGPNKSLVETPESEGVGFRMTGEQVARLANLVDVSFHTHEHYDHVDFELVGALLAAGKTVVVTESNRQLWAEQPWHDQLTVLAQTLDKPLELGPLKIDVLHDKQWDNEAHTKGTPCNAFLVTTPEGIGVLSKGDINCSLRFYGWLQALVKRGRHADLFVGTPFYWRGADLTQDIDALLQPIWCIGHVWEFTHRKAGESGGATGMYGMNCFIQQQKVRKGAVRVLSWGEHLDYVPAAR